MMAPPLRTSPILPNCESLTHFSKLWSSVRPRVRVTSPAFHRPGNFLMLYFPSGPFSLYSMTSCSIFMPLTSVMLLITTPSISIPNEWPTPLPSYNPAIFSHLLFLGLWIFRSLGYEAGAAGELGQLEDHELRRLHRRDPDLADDLAGVDTLRGVGLPITLDVERLVRGQPEQRPLAPFVDQERADGPADLRPQRIVVRLEHHPVRPVQDRL